MLNDSMLGNNCNPLYIEYNCRHVHYAYQHSHTGSVEPPSSELSSQKGEAVVQETAEEQEGRKGEEGEQAETGPQQDELERLQQQVTRTQVSRRSDR